VNGIDPAGLTLRDLMQQAQYLLTIDGLSNKYRTIVRALDYEQFCDMDKI
jgi:hypothetical protein